MISQIQVGEQQLPQGSTFGNQRGGRQADTIISQLHGKYYEQNFNGNLYCFGLSNTALVSANAIATGLTATAQPVIGIYNPLSSGKNVSILQAIINTTTVANTAVSPGGFMWVYSIGNANLVTTGSNGLNCKSMVADQASGVKCYAISTALTGLVNSLAVLRCAAMNSVNAAGPATAISQATNNPLELVDGSIIVPPGGVVGIMNQVSTTTVSCSVGIMYEIIPA